MKPPCPVDLKTATTYALQKGVELDSFDVVRIKHTTTAGFGGWSHACLLYVNGRRVKRIGGFSGELTLLTHYLGTVGVRIDWRSEDECNEKMKRAGLERIGQHTFVFCHRKGTL